MDELNENEFQPVEFIQDEETVLSAENLNETDNSTQENAENNETEITQNENSENMVNDSQAIENQPEETAEETTDEEPVQTDYINFDKNYDAIQEELKNYDEEHQQEEPRHVEITENQEEPETQNTEEIQEPAEPENSNDTSNFDTAFAIAWSENQGSYSEGIAKKIINFSKLQGLKINSVLDICCGSANLLNTLSNYGLKCTGTEIFDSYVAYDKQKYPNISFYKTENVIDIDSLGKYDLVTCNHDVVNYLSKLDDWETLFKKVYEHLNNGGLFIFDYYTKRKLDGWNEVTYSENDHLDYIKRVTAGDNQTTISNVYYINLSPKTGRVADREYSFNNEKQKFKRAENSNVEYFFENEQILNAIKRSGYRYLITVDANFKPIQSIADQNRMHIIAIKREK